MPIIYKHIPFVKEQISFHEKQAQKYSAEGKYPNPYRHTLHKSTQARFEALLEDIGHTENPVSNSSQADKIQLQIFPSDLKGLPQELLQELSVQSGDSLEMTILKVIEDYGDIATLDQLLIGVYRTTEEIHKRSNFTAKLYRMIQKRMIFSVPGKKGVYSIHEFSSEDEAENFISKRNNDFSNNKVITPQSSKEEEDFSDLI